MPEPGDELWPELDRLGNGPRFAARAESKRAFWRLVRHDHVVPEAGVPSALRDLVSAERLEALEGPGVLGEPVRYRRPHDLDDLLEERSPQFCLRNLERYEKDAWVDDLWWTTTELRDTPAKLAALLAPVHRADQGERELTFLERQSREVIAELREERLDLLERTEWRAFTWRRGPRGAPDDYEPA